MPLTAEEIEEDWLPRMAVLSPGLVLGEAAGVLVMGLFGVLGVWVGVKDSVTTNLFLLATGVAELYAAKAFWAWARWRGQPPEQRVTRQRMVILHVIGQNSLTTLYVVTVFTLAIIWLAGRRIHPTVGHLVVLIAIAQYPVIGAIVLATAPRSIRRAYRWRRSRKTKRISPIAIIITFVASMLGRILPHTTLMDLFIICTLSLVNLFLLSTSVAGLYQVYILGRTAIVEASQSQDP